MSKTIVVTLLLVVASMGGLLYWNATRDQVAIDTPAADLSSEPQEPAQIEHAFPREDTMSEAIAPSASFESSSDQSVGSAEPAESQAEPAPDAIQNPIPIVAAVGRLLASKGQLGPGLEIPAMHRQLELEEKDLEWGSQVEYEMRRFLGSHAVEAGFTIDLVECRATMCEIQSTALDTSMQARWGELMGQMRREPWAVSMIGSAVYSGAEDNMARTLGIVTIVRRRQ